MCGLTCRGVVTTLLATFILTACSSIDEQRTDYLKQERSAYYSATSCCKDFSEFNYVTLNAGKSEELDINDDFQAYEFPEGKSYFRAVALPDLHALSRDYSLRVKTWTFVADDSAFVGVRFAFQPNVLLLDQNFRIVKRYSQFNMQHVEHFTTTARQAEFALTGALKNTRYVVVYTDASKIGQATRQTGGKLAEINQILAEDTTTDEITNSYEGSVTFSLVKK